MASFFRRRYMRKPESVGGVERAASVVILVLLVGIVGAFIWQSATDDARLFESDALALQGGQRGGERVAGDAANPWDHRRDACATVQFPDPGTPEWRAPEQVSRFTPDNLYEKINGRAALYLQYSVVGLTFGTYRHETGDERTIDVYWYDMAQPENALGIYRSESPPDPDAVSIGGEGYQTGGAVFFVKGSQYVQVMPGGADERDATVAMVIARAIGDTIEQGDESPWAMDVLPGEGRVPNSFEYLAEDVFGLEFLRDVFAADYDVPGGQVRLFIHRAADAATAGALYDDYLAYFREYGEIVWTDADPARRIAAGEAVGVIDTVFVKGAYFGGAAGAEDVETAKQAATAFYNDLAIP